jgi:PKD repeat protein
MPDTKRLTAYGSAAKGAGYSNSITACSTNTSGEALLATDDSAVFVYADEGDAGSKVYLVKVAEPDAPAHFYNSGDGYAAGQKVYVTIQDLEGIYGDITNTGWYTVALDDGFNNSVYITTLESVNQVTQPTECESAPITAFTGTPTTLVARNTVAFTDESSESPSEWSWTLPGGTPSTSTEENPVITYNDPGVFDVTLVATNDQGATLLLKDDYITVTWNRDEGKPTNPEVSKDFVINTYKNLTIQRARTVDQIPFSLGTKGPPSLRGAVQAYSSSFGGDKSP